ncbi:MAG: hypothetical protein P8R02_14470 [Pseudomonadales bacterium]|nr:hypothetical protein [Pseudomonadales bacterium]
MALISFYCIVEIASISLDATFQNNLFEGNPFQSNPFQSNPFQSNPFRSNRFQNNVSAAFIVKSVILQMAAPQGGAL